MGFGVSRKFAIFALHLGCALGFSVAGLARPCWAAQTAADESKAWAAKGADLFKKALFLDAAQAFEKAYSLDAKDFRVLRYAGRSWQEVGFYDRALKLLLRYVDLETDPELRKTANAQIDKLKAATPVERADALDRATKKYPQARLEDEAAKAYEAIGDARSLERALELWEVARLSLPDETSKRYVDGRIQELRDRIKGLNAPAQQAPKVTAQAAAPASGDISVAQYAAWGGGVALVGLGAALMVVGAAEGRDANDSYQAHKTSYAAYKDAHGAGDLKYFSGIGLTVVGAGAAVAGFFLGPSDAPNKPAVWLAPDPSGLVVAGRF